MYTWFTFVLYLCSLRRLSFSFQLTSMRTVHITSSRDSSFHFELLRKSRSRRTPNSPVHSKGQNAAEWTCINPSLTGRRTFLYWSSCATARSAFSCNARSNALICDVSSCTIVRHSDYAPVCTENSRCIKMKQITWPQPGELSLDLSISDTDSKHLDPITRGNDFLQLNKRTQVCNLAIFYT